MNDTKSGTVVLVISMVPYLIVAWAYTYFVGGGLFRRWRYEDILDGNRRVPWSANVFWHHRVLRRYSRMASLRKKGRGRLNVSMAPSQSIPEAVL